MIPFSVRLNIPWGNDDSTVSSSTSAGEVGALTIGDLGSGRFESTSPGLSGSKERACAVSPGHSGHYWTRRV
jgi:hypothetical protein